MKGRFNLSMDDKDRIDMVKPDYSEYSTTDERNVEIQRALDFVMGSEVAGFLL